MTISNINDIDQAEELESGTIEVFGARVHNLKNIDVCIPRNKLSVITGLSGSGKSSLAFDTIYAEGQRRYVETFSAYARQFLGGMERPDVDKITGLSPVISIEQKTTNKNPRSTVGTITELYDFLRLLFARAGVAHSYKTGEEMVKYTDEKIVDMIHSEFENKKIYILAPIVKGRKGHYKDLFEQVRKKGFLSVRVDGQIKEIVHAFKLDRYKSHNIEILIDKLQVDQVTDKRLKDSVQTAMKHAKGTIMIQDKESNDIKFYSRLLMCPSSGLAYDEPAPHSFSFNSPHGACSKCKGLGMINEIDLNKIIPNDNLSIYDGGIMALGKFKKNLIFWQLEVVANKYEFSLKDPIKDIPKEALNVVLDGSNETFNVDNSAVGLRNNNFIGFDGVLKYISNQELVGNSKKAKKWADQFVTSSECGACKGQRLKKESLSFLIDGKNIADLANMDLREFLNWLSNIEDRLSVKQNAIAKEILKEIRSRLGFMLDVGLDYLSLNRSSVSLSGGESQRIRLATQIGSQLVNVLYILDEPSIGLHQRDNERLIKSLRQLRDSGNSVIVVEHDKDMINAADYVVDIGPLAGKFGGEVVASGSPSEILKSGSLTSQYLLGEKKIEIPSVRRKGNGKYISISRCNGNNLKNVSVKFPLAKLICVTGVSGSGKSSLVNNTLHPILSHHFYRSLKEPLAYKSISGLDNIDKVVEVNQSPLGRTPRSNPATYTGLFSEIRKLFTKLPESQIRGYKPGRFSFNVKGGRCEVCQGAGIRTVEMNFLPDVYVHCDVCNGKRYNRETLEIRYKGKSIGDVLDMTINQSVLYFENFPAILPKLKLLQQVGLGYINLGQASTTLSGGESQRVKLATELSKRDTGNTVYILDEPTTGLHFEDIRVLMDVINKLVDKGNTVIIIEHNLDVIKLADHLIDVGPEGGRNGGEILFEGTPEEIITCNESITGQFLKLEM